MKLIQSNTVLCDNVVNPFKRFLCLIGFINPRPKSGVNGKDNTNLTVLTVSKFILLFFLASLVKLPAQSLFGELNNNSIQPYEVVAKVGDKAITAEEFFYSYEYGPTFPKRMENSKQIHLKYLINEKLIALEGYNENILTDDGVGILYKDINADLATEEMFKDEILNTIEIDEVEVDSIVKDKQIEVELKWLYSPDIESAKQFMSALNNNATFDSLFNMQINDSVFLDMRSMTSSVYSLKKNNPLLAQIIDTMKAGNYSSPIHVNDEWYIVKLENIWKDMVTNQTEYGKLYFEAKQAALKFAMDKESGKYVDNLLRNENPTIKKDAFDLLRSYLGKFVLPNEKYNNWNLEGNLERALSALGLQRGEQYPGIELVTSDNNSFMVDEFLLWYRNRSLQIKFDETNFDTFSASLESMIWRMVRDKLLTMRAESKGYFEKDWVKTQSSWWRDKVAYSAMRQKIANSVLLESAEVNQNGDSKKSVSEQSYKLMEKMLRVIQQAKKKYDVEINEDVLSKVNVSTVNNPKAVDFYTAKTGGLIPRPPYPTIDNEWVNWE
ncbi:MAG: peptidyl-prolyl cis-trans isomerase [Ignavibacteriales bacterium]|jgi:hypothetical protein|nr:MAG: peptidyl-prolyl cis-trans isomerase [Ignavibacteriales bacterium]